MVCQVEYIAALPNSRRRQALRGLPPTLNGTYERILNQILYQSSSSSTGDIIRIALQWICLEGANITIAELCEAISLQESKDFISAEDLIEEDEISRYCGSLIRKSHDRGSFELAHFSVKEYLQSIDINSTLGMFRYDEEVASESLLRTELRFLMLPEFEITPKADASELIKLKTRIVEHPFYRFATRSWPIRFDVCVDATTSELCDGFFGASMGACFRNWLIAYLSQLTYFASLKDEKATSWITYALRRDCSTLHIAAALAMPKVCKWLIDRGADTHGLSRTGTPLACALAGLAIFTCVDVGHIGHGYTYEIYASDVADTIRIFLVGHSSQADAQWIGSSVISRVLEVCKIQFDARPFLSLLENAETLKALTKEDLLRLVELNYTDHEVWTHEALQSILDLEETTANPQWAEMLFLVQAEIIRREDWDSYKHRRVGIPELSVTDANFQVLVEAAARTDNTDAMLMLLADSRFERYGVRLVAKGRTTLHVAVEEASCNVMKVLLDSRFDFHRVDDAGRSPFHFCSHSHQVPALEILLNKGLSSIDTDD